MLTRDVTRGSGQGSRSVGARRTDDGLGGEGGTVCEKKMAENGGRVIFGEGKRERERLAGGLEREKGMGGSGLPIPTWTDTLSLISIYLYIYIHIHIHVYVFV